MEGEKEREAEGREGKKTGTETGTEKDSKDGWSRAPLTQIFCKVPEAGYS